MGDCLRGQQDAYFATSFHLIRLPLWLSVVRLVVVGYQVLILSRSRRHWAFVTLLCILTMTEPGEIMIVNKCTGRVEVHIQIPFHFPKVRQQA